MKKIIKAWAVECSKNYGIRAFDRRYKAESHQKFLDKEYRGHCIHKVIPCEIHIKRSSKGKGK